MGKFVTLTSGDGFQFQAWRADPKGAPRGGIVVIQEIFGVNEHIRAVADGYAEEGYLAIAPGIFDRAERNVYLDYTPETMQQGIKIATGLDRNLMMADIAATIEAAREGGKVGVVGYCLGGSLAWFASCNLAHVDAAVCYYGGMVLGAADLVPKAPTILHFGEKDDHIPMDGVKAFAKAHPESPVYTYPAGHAFNRFGNAAYDEPSAKLALKRTLDFFAAHVG
jgi:carboxymethylenebutenolidase